MSNQQYSQAVAEISKASNQNEKQVDEGTMFFLSFDLVNSTSFKTIQPKKWIKKIQMFYHLVEASYKTLCNEGDIWKRQGDEVLLYFKLTDIEELYSVFDKIHNILSSLIKEVEKDEGKGILSVKATFWTAFVSKNDTETTSNLATQNSTGNYDFIGPDIDFGFRIATKNAGGIICVDPKIIAMMLKGIPSIFDSPKSSSFKIIDFIKLKGIWGGRYVPIVWFHPDIKKPNKIFPYDEEKRNKLVKTLLNKKTKEISIVSKIFDDLGQSNIIDNLIKKIDCFTLNAESIPSNRIAEVHIAAIIFNEEKNKVFCAKRTPKKNVMPSLWENGCCQLRLGQESIEDIVKKQYEEDFGIKIMKFKKNVRIGYTSLDIIGTYSFINKHNRKVPGFIITGIAKEPEKNISKSTKHSEIKWMFLDDVKKLEDKAVEGFKERILLAHELWHQEALEQQSDEIKK